MRRISKLLLAYVNVAFAAYFTMLSFHSAVWYSLPQADGVSMRGDMTSIQLNLMFAAGAFAYLVFTIITVARMSQEKCDVGPDDSAIA